MPPRLAPAFFAISLLSFVYSGSAQIRLEDIQIQGTQVVIPRPPDILIKVPDEPTQGDRVLWDDATIDIRYGATFNLTSSDPYTYSLDETYDFVDNATSSRFKVLGYCEEKFPFLASDSPSSFCPLRPIPGPELRLSKQSVLLPGQHVSRGYLQEEFVLSATPIWILVADENHPPKWRFLNYFQSLKDPFRTPNNARMTTVMLPPHTFVSLDQAQKEDSSDADIYHFPRQFLFETLQPRTTVVTRVYPKLPGFLHWGAQRLLSVGVASVFWQWMLTILTPITPVALAGWVWHAIGKKRANIQTSSVVD